MYQELNKEDPETVINGELWVKLTCGHLIRLEAADKSEGTDSIPAKIQWCVRCAKKERPKPMEPVVIKHRGNISFEERDDLKQIARKHRGAIEGTTIYYNKKRYWLWRKEWRPW